METACKYAENIVNDEMRKRERLPFEWRGRPGGDDQLWHANVAASNCYEGARESVGFHSDQLTYLGPYPTIASLSLGERTFSSKAEFDDVDGFIGIGTTRIFRLREVIPSDDIGGRYARTFNIPLPHNSVRFTVHSII
jgi:hypothetical protein